MTRYLVTGGGDDAVVMYRVTKDEVCVFLFVFAFLSWGEWTPQH